MAYKAGESPDEPDCFRWGNQDHQPERVAQPRGSPFSTVTCNYSFADGELWPYKGVTRGELVTQRGPEIPTHVELFPSLLVCHERPWSSMEMMGLPSTRPEMGELSACHAVTKR